MNEFFGIVLYNIERDGNLNGVFTNIRIPSARIFTETARRRIDDPGDSDNSQRYDFFYFDSNNNQETGILTIAVDNNNIFNATWVLNGVVQPIFRGRGFLMNERQIAISYWES